MAAISAVLATSSVVGFAFSAICGAILFRLWDDQVQIVQIMITCSIANQATMVWSLRRLHRLARACLTFPPGWRKTGCRWGCGRCCTRTGRATAQALGLFFLAYALYLLVGRGRRAAGGRTRALDAVVGFLGGITGGAAALPKRAADRLLRAAGLGQGAATCALPAFHPAHAGGVTSDRLIGTVKKERRCVRAGATCYAFQPDCSARPSAWPASAACRTGNSAWVVNLLLLVSGLSLVF